MNLTWNTGLWAAFAAATVLACGSAATDESTENLTSDEAALGASWDGQEEDVDPEGDTASALDMIEGPIAAPDPLAGLDEPTDELSCQTAAGYSHGVKTTICITYVDGKPVEVHTAAAYLKMKAAAAKVGVHLYIVSGFRTMAQQRYLYKIYKQGKGNLAAPPGYSNHQSGHALDLNTSSGGVYSWLSNHHSAYGFKRTVPSEKWHWEHW